jgi:hypothetical protein
LVTPRLTTSPLISTDRNLTSTDRNLIEISRNLKGNKL